jgi:plasmid stabilization system protein ParE
LRRPRLLLWTPAARRDLVVAQTWNERDAALLAEVMDRMAAGGWSFGRPVTGRPGVRYYPVPPLAVLYRERDDRLEVLRVLAPRRMRRLPD